MAQSAKAQLSEQEVNDFDIQDNREEFEKLVSIFEIFGDLKNYYALYHFVVPHSPYQIKLLISDTNVKIGNKI